MFTGLFIDFDDTFRECKSKRVIHFYFWVRQEGDEQCLLMKRNLEATLLFMKRVFPRVYIYPILPQWLGDVIGYAILSSMTLQFCRIW